nr:hypothetical protein [uncultured Carboxylicivirga sp.]
MGITKDIIEAEFRTKGGSQVQREMIEVQKNIALITNENERLRVTKAKLESQNKKGSAEWKNVNSKLKENTALLSKNKANLKVLQSQLKVTEMSAKQLSARYSDLKRQLATTNKEILPDRWNRLNNELQATEKQLAKVQGRTIGARKSMFDIKGIASTFLPVLSVTAFIGVLKSIGTELFGLTKQMQGDAVRSATVFGNQLGYVQQEAAKVAKQMGLTNREFVANAAATADLLIPLDFTREQSAKMSVELQRLTGSLDEWTGGSVGAAEVSNILTKAMLGENEQLKQLGIAIRKDSDEFRDLVKVKMAAGDVTKAQAEAMATLELITSKSADAQAAYTKEGNKLYRLQKEMTAWWHRQKEAVVEWLSVSPVEELQREQDEANALVIKLQSANISEETRAKLLERLKTLAPDVAAAITSETSNLNTVRQALEKYNSQMALKILLKEQELKVNNKSDQAQGRQQNLAKREADLVKQLNESRKWFADKAPEYTDQVESLLGDTELTISQKASKIWMLSKEVTGLGNTTLAGAINAYRTQAGSVEEGNNMLQQAISDAEKLKQDYMNIFGVDPNASPTEDNGSPGGGPKKTKTETAFKVNQDKTTGQFSWDKSEGDEYDQTADVMGMVTDSMADREQFAFEKRMENWQGWVDFQNEMYSQMDQDTQEYWATQQAIAQAEEDLNDRKMDTLLAMSNLMAVVAGDDVAAKKAAFLFDKGVAIGQVWQNLPRELAGIAASASLLPPGAREAYITKAMTTAKIRAGINTAAIAATAIQGLGSKKEGGYTGSSSSDDEPMGIYHANEFVANATAVRNPTIRPVLDAIDIAQKNGTISTINLPQAITGGVAASQRGAYSGSAADGVSMPAVPSAEAIASAMISALRKQPLKTVMDYDYKVESEQKMSDLMDDVGA